MLRAAAAVVLREGRALLVQRGKMPNKDLWAYPGGSCEPGETAEDCAVRELAEETGLIASAVSTLTTLTIPHRASGYRLQMVLCDAPDGIPGAASDAADVAWVSRPEMAEGRYPLCPAVLDVMDLALARQPR
ncbi:NUDIX hydrolase [Palleronia caenipelagi]|uniref:NUDIX domain-containing protein n=1 Tax=Palleronia caenipelagi TaxID=2489174 RepID=A0A547Q615_9RHOB|nr:NUDIX domain-containing protein [Palleronia caenipelagi]TRD21825.1 NUDIX domain-containing protein [Palleronia caenipelagi]